MILAWASPFKETRHVCNMIYVRNQFVTSKTDFLHLIFLVRRWTQVANFLYICAPDLYALCIAYTKFAWGPSVIIIRNMTFFPVTNVDNSGQTLYQPELSQIYRLTYDTATSGDRTSRCTYRPTHKKYSVTMNWCRVMYAGFPPKRPSVTASWRFIFYPDASVSAVTLQEIPYNIGIVLRCPAIQINVRSYSIT